MRKKGKHMKRTISLMIAALLLFCGLAAQAADYTLPEKMKKQLEIGSGLKGSFSVTASGYGEEVPLLDALHRTEFEVRGLLADGNLYYCIYQADDSENQNNKTEIFSADGSYYAKSDLMGGRTYTISGLYQAADALSPLSGGEGAAITSAAVKLAESATGLMAQEWEKALEPYRNNIELWINRFPVVTDYTTLADGRNCLEISYNIPYAAMTGFIQETLSAIFQDAVLLNLLDGVLTAEQRELYLNPNLAYYYAEVLKSIQTEEDVVIAKATDSKTGKAVGSRLSLPLDAKATGFSLLTAEQEAGGDSTWTLSGETRMISLSLPAEMALDKDFDYEIKFMNLFYGAEADTPESQALRIRISRKSNGPAVSAEDEKTHEDYSFRLSIEQDSSMVNENRPVKLADFDPIDAELNMHFSGKNAQQSPTTAEVELAYTRGDRTITLSGKFKSAAPWIVTFPETDGAVNLLAASSEEREGLLKELADNAKKMLMHTPEASIPEASAAAPEATPEAAAETAEVQAETAEPQAETETGAGDETKADDTAEEKAADAAPEAEAKTP